MTRNIVPNSRKPLHFFRFFTVWVELSRGDEHLQLSSCFSLIRNHFSLESFQSYFFISYFSYISILFSRGIFSSFSDYLWYLCSFHRFLISSLTIYTCILCRKCHYQLVFSQLPFRKKERYDEITCSCFLSSPSRRWKGRCFQTKENPNHEENC